MTVSWTTDAIEDWNKTWSHQVLGSSKKADTSAQTANELIVDPVVEQALKSLTSVINRPTAVLNTSDDDHAKRILRILRSRNHQYPAEYTRLWLIKKGCLPKAAERLEALAEKAFASLAKPKIDNRLKLSRSICAGLRQPRREPYQLS